MNDYVSRQKIIDAIEKVDWYHQNKNKDMVSGANPSEHQAWYKADDIYKTLKTLPSVHPELIKLHVDHALTQEEIKNLKQKITNSSIAPIFFPTYPEIIRCKECKYFEYNHIENVNGIPFIVAHEICMRWCEGAKTNEDGYCFLAERKNNE